MKAFKLVLAGMAMLVCIFWVATKIKTEKWTVINKIAVKKDSTMQLEGYIGIVTPPFCIPIGLFY